jgi:hypothetical protein
MLDNNLKMGQRKMDLKDNSNWSGALAAGSNKINK